MKLYFNILIFFLLFSNGNANNLNIKWHKVITNSTCEMPKWLDKIIICPRELEYFELIHILLD